MLSAQVRKTYERLILRKLTTAQIKSDGNEPREGVNGIDFPSPRTALE
jgi:hypothetical protein